jgi:pilus assembly protein CpaB
MTTKAAIPLVAGLAVGVFAIKLTYNFVRSARANNVSGEQVSVMRARVDVPMAAEINEKMIELVQTPKAFVPQGAVAKKDEVLGRVTSLMIPKGMPILPSMLSPKGTRPGMESRIPDGFRAVAVKIDESSGVAFLVKPGSRVDVVAVIDVKTNRGPETISKTVIENVEVAAVGQELGEKNDKGALSTKSVTVLVKPEDVPRLHLAAQKGKILLAMRSQTDTTAQKSGQITDKQLVGAEEDAAKSSKGQGGLFTKLMKKTATPPPVVQAPVQVAATPPPPPPEWRVEVVRGANVTEVKFAGPDATQRGDGGAADFTRKAGVPKLRLKGGTDAPRGGAKDIRQLQLPEPKDGGPEADKADTGRESTDQESNDSEQGG